jgi:GGDEF domain-containing protein
MNYVDRMNSFKLAIEPLLPGYLSLVDIAALKQYNHHLGHGAGDHEIASLDELLQTALKDGGATLRVGGEEWCAFVAGSHLNRLDQVIKDFVEVPHETTKSGWRCEATATDGTKARIEISRDIVLQRGVRCGFTELRSIEDFDETLEKLWASISLLPVNAAQDISNLTEPTRASWSRIIGEEVHIPYYCPFCKGSDIEWEEGAEDVGWGFCNTCRASVKYYH